MINAYASFNKNEKIRLESSSGGIFYSLAKRTIRRGGVVFGAAFNKKWMVEMMYVEDTKNLHKLMQSKYSQADLKNTFKEAEKFLKSGRKVLYVGTPCQIFALKKYLKIDYANLLLVDLVCHGVMPSKYWKDYLKLIKKPFRHITNINFRDKSKRSDGNGGWHDFNFRIDYSDGTSLVEAHGNNKYMKAFLGDHYLKDSCYNCRFKNENSSADITMGDFWLVNKYHKKIDDDKGISAIITHTTKGDNIIKSLKDISLFSVPYNEILSMGGGMLSVNSKKRKKYRNLFVKRKKVGIISIPLDMNPGGVIQSYVLEHLIENFGYEATTISVHRRYFPEHLKFADDTMNIKMLPFSEYLQNVPYHLIDKNEFDTIVIGSDQIWRRTEINIEEIFLDFTKGWGINRFVYGASFGASKWQYSDGDSKYVHTMLSKYFNGVSVREIDGVKNCERYFNVKTSLVLDPVFLCDKDFYLNLCKDIPPSKNGVMCHILDNNQDKANVIDKACRKFNLNKMQYDKKSVESWLAAIRDSKFVITDSYHGCVFSIIFNKPFICFYNKDRGKSRFDTLNAIFHINDRLIYKRTNKINFNSLKTTVSVGNDFFKLRHQSLKFLRTNLKRKASFNERRPLIKLKIHNNKLKIHNKIIACLKSIFPRDTIRGKLIRIARTIINKTLNRTFNIIKKIAKKFWICRFIWAKYKFRKFTKESTIAKKRFQPAVIQLLPGFNKGDAIGNMVLEISNKLNEKGIVNFIVCEDSNETYFNLCKVNDFHFEKNDIVVYHMSIGSSCSYRFKNEMVGKKIMIYHNITPSKFFKYNKKLASACKRGRKELKLLSNVPNVSIAVSAFNKKELDILKYKNTSVIPCMHQIDKLLSYKPFCNKQNKKIFITVGRLATHKCIDDVIRVFYEYHKMNSDSILYIIGRADNNYYLDKIEKLIKKLHLTEFAILLGAVSDKKLAHFYTIADAYICMSEHEGFCVPLIEAMAFGVPVFAYNSSAISETIGDAGFLFNNKKYYDIASNMYKIIENNSVTKKMISKGLERYKHFNNKHNIDKYLQAFDLTKEYFLSSEVILLYKLAFDEYKKNINENSTLPFSFAEYCDRYNLKE